MICSTSQTATPDSAFPVAPSKTAEKIVLRIPVVLKQAIENVARRQFRSFNSEVALAVISHFEGHRRLITMRNSLVNRIGGQASEDVLASFHRVSPDVGTLHPYNIRFPDGLRDELKGASSSMRDLVANACADWVFYSNQIEALLKRCEDPDIRFPAQGFKH